MKKTLISVIAFCLAATIARASKPECIAVKAGDAMSFLDAIEQANKRNAAPDAERLFIIVPSGRYDLGERVLTTLTANNVAIIGCGMDNTIIINKPDISEESISKTATLRVRGTGTYIQDLTIQNALDYYHAGAAGRAVTLHDKGTQTICKNVRLLSYQDTYYSDNEDQLSYFETSEIHGTVDFICGAGDVYFKSCTIVTERRTANGSGRNVIAAPRTSHTKWGYVFDGCTVWNRVSDFHYARGWHTSPRCVWLNTKLMSPERLRPERFDPQGMRTAFSYFKEYRTTDAEGNIISPQSNVITITCKDESNTTETILTKDEAKRYTVKNVFPKWRPDKIARRLQKQAARLVR